MHPSLADFEIHLSHPNPGFHCYAAGDKSNLTQFTALVSHQINDPADDHDLARLSSILETEDADFFKFYKRHNGLTLYCDTRTDDAGIRFYSIAEWPSITDEVRNEFIEMRLDELYGPLVNGIVFGEICHSANYFFYQTRAENRGAIYYLMHDPLYDEGLRFESLGSLISEIIGDPAQFLYDMGCYTRYSDGVTDKQWIPQEYLADVKAV